MTMFKYLAIVLIVIVGTFYIVANYSAIETKYKCEGELDYAGNIVSETIYVKYEQYRWWVGLWSDSYGNFWIEFSDKMPESFRHVTKTGTELHMFNYEYLDSGKKLTPMEGSLSLLSNKISIFKNKWSYKGQCSSID